MKTIFAILSLAFLVAPAFAIADDTPATAQGAAPAGMHAQLTPEQRQALSAAMQQFSAQAEQMRIQTRAQILSSLSPAHRALLANIVGQLAIAPNPNRTAAAAQLDAVLSSGEREAVLRAHQNLMAQMRTLHQQMRSQLEAVLPARPEHMGPPGEGLGPNARSSRPAPDAGSILLHLAGPGEMEHGGPMFMGMPPRP
jgi:hypothetical protein